MADDQVHFEDKQHCRPCFSRHLLSTRLDRPMTRPLSSSPLRIATCCRGGECRQDKPTGLFMTLPPIHKNASGPIASAVAHIISAESNDATHGHLLASYTPGKGQSKSLDEYSVACLVRRTSTRETAWVLEGEVLYTQVRAVR